MRFHNFKYVLMMVLIVYNFSLIAKCPERRNPNLQEAEAPKINSNSQKIKRNRAYITQGNPSPASPSTRKTNYNPNPNPTTNVSSDPNSKAYLPPPQYIPNQIFPIKPLVKTPKPTTIPLTAGPLVVIDAGHGGEDKGAESSKGNKYQEKYLTLATAMMLKTYLHQLGYRTVMTRKDDVFVSLENRAKMANGLESDIFVSVHYNTAPNQEAEGIEVFYFRSEENKERAKESKQLADLILKNVLINTSAKSRGVKHGNLAVIRETKMPAILIEGGFLTNEVEREKIKNPFYLKKLAWGIAKGIDAYYQRS